MEDTKNINLTAPNAATAKRICYLVLFAFIIAGALIIALQLGPGFIGNLLLYTGISGLIGLATNALAIKMILDYVRIPLTKIKIPMSGLLPENFSKITDSVGREVADNILNSDTLKQELKSQQSFAKILNSLKANPISDQHLHRFQQLLSQQLIAKTKTDEFYFQIRDGLIKSFVKQKPILKIANLTGIIDYDDTTYQIIDVIAQKAKELQTSPEAANTLRTLINDSLSQLQTTTEDIEDELINFLTTSLLVNFDIASAIKNKLDALSAAEVKNMILQLASDYFGWIELWGGIVGAVVGLVLSMLV